MSTYQRPAHLRRALQSIALQQGVEGRFELVVTDDGSTDETPEIVAEFARSVPFHVGFTTHPHKAFQLSRCRNDGVRASRAPYLLFLDGDCILPPDHLAVHLARRKPGVVMAGDCVRLEEEASARVTSEVIRAGAFTGLASDQERRRLRKQYRSAWFYRLIHHPTKPKMIGNNVGIWREDFERVNGYDENFQGWGCEDDDLRLRLRRAGVTIESIVRWTNTYHLWHPVDPSAPMQWRQGANVNYLLRKGRLVRCRNGLEKRSLDDLAVQVVGSPDFEREADRLLRGRFADKRAKRPEVEILFLPGEGGFSGRADCNLLVALDAHAVDATAAREAHMIVTADDRSTPDDVLCFSLDKFEDALAAVA